VTTQGWTRRKGWIAAAFAAAWAVILVFLVISTAIGSESGVWAAILVLALGVIGFIATLLVTEGVPWGADDWSDWLQKRPMASIYIAMFAALGVMTGALGLLQRSPSIESKPGAIEKGIEEIRTKLGLKSHPPRIRLKLPGIWGERGCAVTYRFQLRERVVLVQSVRRPGGTPPFRLVATITSVNGDIMTVVGEEPDTARGKAATFTYESNGMTERVTWDDQVSPVPLELDRCA
jgi:hypothetical protein